MLNIRVIYGIVVFGKYEKFSAIKLKMKIGLKY